MDAWSGPHAASEWVCARSVLPAPREEPAVRVAILFSFSPRLRVSEGLWWLSSLAPPGYTGTPFHRLSRRLA